MTAQEFNTLILIVILDIVITVPISIGVARWVVRRFFWDQ